MKRPLPGGGTACGRRRRRRQATAAQTIGRAARFRSLYSTGITTTCPSWSSYSSACCSLQRRSKPCDPPASASAHSHPATRPSCRCANLVLAVNGSFVPQTELFHAAYEISPLEDATALLSRTRARAAARNLRVSSPLAGRARHLPVATLIAYVLSGANQVTRVFFSLSTRVFSLWVFGTSTSARRGRAGTWAGMTEPRRAL